jgi:hypothetical protein
MSSRPPALRALSPQLTTSQLSPRLLTPDEALHSSDIYSFPKQPLPQVKATSVIADESAWSDEAMFSVNGDTKRENPHVKPISLLTTLLQSPDHQHTKKSTGTPSIVSSALSSAPSTAISSPNGPAHGILQKAGSILRRGSTSSESGEVGLGLGGGIGLESLAGRLERVEEKREKVGWADEVKVS